MQKKSQKNAQKKTSHRSERVAELLQRELAIVLQTEIEDPRVKKATLTNVDLSPDLRHAKIYFTTLDDDDKEIQTVAHALNHAVSYLRRRIAKIIKLRLVPELYFVHDESLRKAQYLTTLINNIVPRDAKSD